MKLETIVPLPPEDYLYNLGLIVYSVGYLEWILLGDLCNRDSELPEQLKFPYLVGKSTGQIAKLLMDEQKLALVSDNGLRDRMRKFGQALEDIAKRRNSALHARSAKITDKTQGLYRWLKSEQFEINEDFLRCLNDEIQNAIREDANRRR